LLQRITPRGEGAHLGKRKRNGVSLLKKEAAGTLLGVGALTGEGEKKPLTSDASEGEKKEEKKSWLTILRFKAGEGKAGFLRARAEKKGGSPMSDPTDKKGRGGRERRLLTITDLAALREPALFSIPCPVKGEREERPITALRKKGKGNPTR